MFTHRNIQGKDALLQKIVFELRYDRGFAYLDRCGRLINTILDTHPEWTVDPNNPNPQGASLVSLANSCVLSVGTRKMDLAIETPIGGDPISKDDVEYFSEQAKDLTILLMDQLGINTFSRIGCRLWYIFPCDSQEESEEWLNSLNCYSVNTALVDAFGGNVEALGVSVVINGSDRVYRIAFNGVHRTASLNLGDGILNIQVKQLSEKQRETLRKQEKVRSRVRRSPEYPAMIDIDAYVESPDSPEVSDFVMTTFDTSIEKLATAVRKK